jgi:pimeloyl-ACP methyl ester carboxylesterase
MMHVAQRAKLALEIEDALRADLEQRLDRDRDATLAIERLVDAAHAAVPQRRDVLEARGHRKAGRRLAAGHALLGDRRHDNCPTIPGGTRATDPAFAMAAKHPTCTALAIPHGRHRVVIEQPRAVAAAVLGFLAVETP